MHLSLLSDAYLSDSIDDGGLSRPSSVSTGRGRNERALQAIVVLSVVVIPLATVLTVHRAVTAEQSATMSTSVASVAISAPRRGEWSSLPVVQPKR